MHSATKTHMNLAGYDRRYFYLLAAGLILALAVVGLRNQAPATTPGISEIVEGPRVAGSQLEDDSAAPPQRNEVTDSRHAGVYHARVGSRFVFDLDYAADFSLSMVQDGAVHPGGDHHMHAHGELQCTVAARRPGEILTLGELKGLKIDDAPGAKAAAKAAAKEVAAQCQIPLLIKISEEGQLLGYAFDERQGFEARTMLRGLFGPLAFVVPHDAAKTWDVESEDSTGTFSARYRRTPTTPDAGLALRRSKTRYLSMAGFDNGVGKHEIRGSSSAHIDEDLGWLRDAAVDESLDMALPIGAGSASSRTRITLKLSRADWVAEVYEGDPWSCAFMPVSGVPEEGAHAEMEMAQWREALEGVTLQDLLIELEALLAAGQDSSREVMQAWTKIAWMVTLDEEVAAELRDVILANAVNEKVANMCLSALGKSGSPAAQAALVGVLESAGLSMAVRSSAAIGMYGIQKPGTEVFESLSKQVGDMRGLGEVRGSSLLAFGELAGRSSQPMSDGRTPTEHLLAMEAKAKRADASASWLDAVGNSGDADTLERVVVHLKNKDPEVRRSAVEALRHHQDPRAATAIERVAVRDQDINVRARAVQVLGMRNDGHAAKVLFRLAREDKSPVMRRAALGEVAAIAHPDAEALLTQSAKMDPDSGVREFAQKQLDSAR